MKVNTGSELAYRQYRANVEFAAGYAPRCAAPALGEDGVPRPRVLVTGFGRFLENPKNATGMLVSELVPELEYPLTEAPPSGQIDPPEPQLAVATGTLELSGSGTVDVCALVLPVFWDLAAVLVAREIAAFSPDLVIMNGIAGSAQPLWLELGAVNHAAALTDGSGVLVAEAGPIVAHASSDAYARPNLLSWDAVRTGAEAAIGEHAGTVEAGAAFGDLVTGVRLAGYPRASNTYLCNNTTYAVGYLMDHADEAVRLLEPTHGKEGEPMGLEVALPPGFEATPRVFVHWPSSLDGAHLVSAASVLAHVIDAQLVALAEGPLPVRGDTVTPDLPGDG